ncbi:MAG: hypothetical protein ACE5HI_11205 [bacterium]
MKRVTTSLSLVVLSFALLVGVHQAKAQAVEVDWHAFSKNLAANLFSPNPGVQQSAMQLLAKYGNESTFEWTALSKKLNKNLLSTNQAQKKIAVQLIAKYGDRLNLSAQSVFELVRIYRWEKDTQYRQMALVALHSIQNKWAMDFLKRSFKFEENPVLKHTIAAIVLDYES